MNQKMKNNIKFILQRYSIRMLPLIAACCLASCETSLVENPLGIVGEVNFYTNKGEAESGLIGAMSQMNVDVALGPDDIKKNGYTDLNNDGIRDAPIVLGTDYGILNWQRSYKSVTNVNNVIRSVNAGKVQGASEDELAIIVGQAKFIRALNYFNLVRLYGELPLITEDSPNPVTNPYTKSRIEDVYSLIVSDLQFAASELPDSWTDTPGRPTSWVAKGILAKVYLTMATAPLKQEANYAKSASLAKEIIESNKFNLIPDVADVFKIESKRASEMMFAFEATTDDAVGIPNGLASKNSGGYSDGALDTTFAAYEFPEQPRKYAYIQMEIPDVLADPGNVILIPWKQAFEYAPIISKFNYPYVNAEDILAKAVYPMNVPILRYAEVLLIYAEAANRQNGGPTQEAVDAINEVINRANGITGTEPLATTAMAMQDFEDKVIQERKFELCFESGSRWYDMVRKELTQYHVTTDLFPIPEYDANLLGQNPGY
jgi:starch-binding outer membrane protein, SusD/RagB family